MQLTCPRCHHALEFSGDRPSFCGYCGSALAETQASPAGPDAAEAPTLAPGPSSGPAIEDEWPPAPRVAPPGPPAPGGEPAAPEVVGGYRLLRVLGGGGMGNVYEAQDTTSGRRVALKLISPQYAGSPDAVERFRQEGRLASAIAHPRCVFVLAADEDAGRPYIVMELMLGSTLEDRLADKGPLAPEDAIAAILDVIEGLEEAHRHGVIHRDVKPSNCFLDADGRVKVGDFGLSKSLAGNARLTRTGAFLGTPLYASPEQIKGEALDPQTDVYSTAATLYFLLTGRAPFQSGDMAATVARIVSDPAPSMRSLRPDLDPRLDQVVLRGLERDRARRWRDLAEFRAALQEFLPGRLSLAGLGIRFGAYAIDWLLKFFVEMILSLVLVAQLGAERLMHAQYEASAQLPQLAMSLPWVLYYTVLEGVWGASLGKFLLRLRVRRVRDGSAPGLARALARAASMSALFSLGVFSWVATLALLQARGTRFEDLMRQYPLQSMPLSFLPLGGLLAGVGLMLLPMRRRNGYRGLHEFLSGTRVVLLPSAARRAALQGEGFEPPLLPAQHYPERLGPFVVRGALGGGAGATVLAAKDTSLGRDVWIWLRPRTDPPLADARRQLSRAARLRWLACGTHGEAQWDAFIAPAGSPLTEIIRRKGRFAWPQVRPLLEALTDELVEACADETVPDPLWLEQVWVQPNGAARLLDMPWGDEPAGEGPEAEAPEEEPAGAAQRRALALLRQVAALALEGAPRPARSARPVRPPLPRHAAEMLARLLAGRSTCRKFQTALRDTRDRPVEVTRPRRLAHLGALTALLFVGAGCCMFPTGWFIEMTAVVVKPIGLAEQEKTLRYLDEGAWRDFAVAGVGAGPGCWPALGQLHADLDLRERLRDKIEGERRRADAQFEVLSPITRQQALIGMKSVREQEARNEESPNFQGQTQYPRTTYRREAEHVLAVGVGPPPEFQARVAGLALGGLLTWPVLWVAWAFLLRGGLSYRIAQIDLVRSDGRPALRLQCAWRALLVWAPVTGLLLLSLWLQLRFWSAWDRGEVLLGLHTLSTVLWYAALALPVVYVALALARPTRALHDRLAGTYLVPK